MTAWRATWAAVLVGVLAGCQAAPGPIFPPISPAIVWPPPPDRARIRYVGALHGEADLGIRPTGWEAFRAALGGPQPRAEFSRPTAVAVAGERVYVADPGLAAVHRLDLAERSYRVMRGAKSDPMKAPIDVTVAGGDSLIVVDRARAAVDVFDLDGNWRATRRWPELQAPTGAVWDAGHSVLWLVDAAAHACFACQRWQDLQRRIGGRGEMPGQFNYPAAAAWHPQVGLVVADAMNFRIQVFDEAGRPTAVFGKKGDAAGDFSLPRDVAVDSDGHIYVLDNQFENVQVFDRHGQLLMAFGHEGRGPGEFSLPSGITIDEKDRIWIADSYNRRVQVFQYLREET